MFPTASTLTRAWVDAGFGTTPACGPSFGVLGASTHGYVCPPSADSEIFTSVVLTGAPLVPATSHVTVCVEPPAHVLGADVTRNGPVVLASRSVVSAPFTPTLRSRVVSRKCSESGLELLNPPPEKPT